MGVGADASWIPGALLGSGLPIASFSLWGDGRKRVRIQLESGKDGSREAGAGLPVERTEFLQLPDFILGSYFGKDSPNVKGFSYSDLQVFETCGIVKRKKLHGGQLCQSWRKSITKS